MPRFEAELTLYFEAADLSDAAAQFDELCDMIATTNEGVTISEEAEVGPAIEMRT